MEDGREETGYFVLHDGIVCRAYHDETSVCCERIQ
jgi:hypothetical protein